MNLGVVCGDCGAPMVLRRSRFGQFWGCTRWPDCQGKHGAHPDGSPMGIPGDATTRQARIEAHAAFDGAWQSRGLTRKQAYRWLRELTGKSVRGAHISRFSAEECRLLVERIALAEATRFCEAEQLAAGGAP